MKLIIVFSAFLAIFCCFSQIEFTSAEPTLDGLVGGLLGGVTGGGLGGLLGGLGGGGGGLPLAGGLLGAEQGTSQTNEDDVSIKGNANSVFKGVELKGNLNVLPNGLL
ncbi:chaperone protein DnaJ-like [Episyrphus balteatus]|uniref:chaperone protein DnaJ-like n=1 Tax=Episyrphus balteatus TaxID=286459 RepID=UPI0024857C69|nr:chaperone protein DnaJ-like [Episyrphus balteatus]